MQHPTVKQAVQDAVLAEPPKDLVQSPFARISAKASIAVESIDIAIPSDDPYAVRRVMDRVKLAQPGQSRIRIRSKVWVEEINLNVLCLFRTSFYLSAKKLSINNIPAAATAINLDNRPCEQIKIPHSSGNLGRRSWLQQV
jgi:hypothetical protein